jgi:hypothetical protein
MSAQHDPLPEPLPEQVLDHLGRKLRSELRIEETPPAFLGDDTLPPRFAGLVRQIERSEATGQKGIDAIRREFGLEEE